MKCVCIQDFAAKLALDLFCWSGAGVV